jgi:hypothetical protein
VRPESLKAVFPAQRAATLLLGGGQRPPLSAVPAIKPDVTTHDRLLTETDGPFTKTNNRPIYPQDVQAAVDELAKLHRLPAENIAQLILNNLDFLLTK